MAKTYHCPACREVMLIGIEYDCAEVYVRDDVLFCKCCDCVLDEVDNPVVVEVIK